MGIRRINSDETRWRAPDSSYLATGVRENLVGIIRNWPEIHTGHRWYNAGSFFYDINRGITLPIAGAFSSLIWSKSYFWMPDGINDQMIYLFGSCDKTDSNHFFRVQFYDYATATAYNFDIDNLSATETYVSRVCSGLAGNSYYRLWVYAWRLTTTTADIYTLKNVITMPYIT